jgi:hypothetical protein
MRHNDKFDCMMKMREQGGMTEEKLTRCKEKYNNAKRKGASNQTLDKNKERYKHHKKTHMIYTMEYEQLKKRLGVILCSVTTHYQVKTITILILNKKIKIEYIDTL